VIKKVPLLEYAPPGSKDLAEMVVKEFSDPSVKSVLLKDHGTVSVGKDLEDAIKISEWLEDAAFHSYLSIQMKKQVI
jgi:L-fuculose-phosphate aldolase